MARFDNATMPRRPSFWSTYSSISKGIKRAIKAVTPKESKSRGDGNYLTVFCPLCNVKINLRESSVGTVRTCENCGYKFVPDYGPPPAVPQQPQGNWLLGCLVALVAFVAMPLLCCGGFAFLASTGQPVADAPPTIRAPAKASPPTNEPVIIVPPSKPKTVASVPDPPPVEPEPTSPTVEPAPELVKLKYELRTWHSASGKFSVEASFVRLSSGKVVLRKEDGEEFEVDEGKLSSTDVNYIEGLRGANKLGGAK